MIQYILECIAFQLVFLIIYDFFLKRETFFQWNRLYLIGTYILSLVLPWIKIEALKTAVPVQYYRYPEYLWGANDAVVEATAQSADFQMSWQEAFFSVGCSWPPCSLDIKCYSCTGCVEKVKSIIIETSRKSFLPTATSPSPSSNPFFLGTGWWKKNTEISLSTNWYISASATRTICYSSS